MLALRLFLCHLWWLVPLGQGGVPQGESGEGQGPKQTLCCIIYFLSKSQESPCESEFHVCLWSLPAAMWVALIPNLQIPWELTSEGGPRLGSSFTVHSRWSMLVFLCLSPNSKLTKEERPGPGEGHSFVPIEHNSWIPTWLIQRKIKCHCADSYTNNSELAYLYHLFCTKFSMPSERMFLMEII